MDGIITSTVNVYIHTFNAYFSQFLKWGQEFFFTGLVITIVWLCLWNAFDKNSFQDSMPNFLKEFFIIALFYTIMIYGNDWLSTIPESASIMGRTLSSVKVDPSSIIDQGIKITNLLTTQVHPSGILEKMYAAFVVALANILIMFAFVSVALDLAVTLLIIYFFIAISGFALAFSVFSFTRAIARKTLDIVIANSMKLLTLYVVVAAGSGVFTAITQDLKTTTNPFDVLGWVVAAAFLFWLVCRNIPSQVARIFSDAVQETRGTNAAALAMSAVSTARTTAMATSALKTAVTTTAGGAFGAARVTGSAIRDAAAHYSQSRMQGLGMASSAGKAVGSTAKDALRSGGGGVADRFKHAVEKLSGGKGMVDEKGKTNIPSFAQRMYQSAQGTKNLIPTSAGSSSSTRSGAVMGSAAVGNAVSMNSSGASSSSDRKAATGSAAAGNAVSMNSAGAPSSSGRKAAAESKTRSTPRKVKPK